MTRLGPITIEVIISGRSNVISVGGFKGISLPLKILPSPRVVGVSLQIDSLLSNYRLPFESSEAIR